MKYILEQIKDESWVISEFRNNDDFYDNEIVMTAPDIQTACRKLGGIDGITLDVLAKELSSRLRTDVNGSSQVIACIGVLRGVFKCSLLEAKNAMDKYAPHG